VSERRQLLLMVAPYVCGVVVLVALPALATFALAVTDYDLVRAPSFVGLENFRELASDEVFRTALGNSLLFAAVGAPLRVGVALGLALLLHRRFRGVSVARSGVVLPTVVPEVAFGLLWLWLLNPVYGPINLALDLVGPPGVTVWGQPLPQWLTDPGDARAAIVLITLFTIGEGFVLFLVARQTMPSELYELAEVEDASAWVVARRVTLPLLAPLVVLMVLRDALLMFQLTFVPALVVTEGGPPLYATTTLPLFVYRTGFEYLRYGYAAAATLVIVALTVLLLGLQWRVIRRWRRSLLA
jgi:multiple sugar transport system permease protein